MRSMRHAVLVLVATAGLASGLVCGRTKGRTEMGTRQSSDVALSVDAAGGRALGAPSDGSVEGGSPEVGGRTGATPAGPTATGGPVGTASPSASDRMVVFLGSMRRTEFRFRPADMTEVARWALFDFTLLAGWGPDSRGYACAHEQIPLMTLARLESRQDDAGNATGMFAAVRTSSAREALLDCVLQLLPEGQALVPADDRDPPAVYAVGGMRPRGQALTLASLGATDWVLGFTGEVAAAGTFEKASAPGETFDGLAGVLPDTEFQAAFEPGTARDRLARALTWTELPFPCVERVVADVVNFGLAVRIHEPSAVQALLRMPSAASASESAECVQSAWEAARALILEGEKRSPSGIPESFVAMSMDAFLQLVHIAAAQTAVVISLELTPEASRTLWSMLDWLRRRRSTAAP